ncbi:hypothetical protein [Rhizobium wenxiniae]|uniref:hypothetical protein n=1 Tax=Rhizobium wenxiniae TaxID=1737357 RepID=UPI003C29D4AB
MDERNAAQARIQRIGTAALTAKAAAKTPDITTALLSPAAFSMAVKSAFRRTEKPERAMTHLFTALIAYFYRMALSD